MGKTISLKLTPDEERIVDLMHQKGLSHSVLLRDALRHYFNLVDQTVYRSTGEAVNQAVDPVYHSTGEVVDQVDQTVYRSTGEAVNQAVDQVDQKVNPVDQADKYLNLYIEQLNTRTHQLESETKEWKSKYVAEVEYLKESYNLLQAEYHNQIKDSIKRIDDKFDRIMFYMEESRKPALQSLHIAQDSETKSDDIFKIGKNRDANKPKKGWIFKMYRM